MTTLPHAAVFTAVPTPFDTALDVDLGCYRALLVAQRDAGVDGVFCVGSTAEFTTLHRDERRALVEVALEVFGADRVVAHIGAAAAHLACAFADDAMAAGARRLAAVAPFYFVDRRDGVQAYYTALDAHLDGRAELAVYLYAQRIGYRLDPDVLGSLAALPSVTGAKISGEPAASIGAYVRATPADFLVFTGNDAEFAASVGLGAAGVASGAAAVWPELFVALAGALRAGDVAAVAAAEERTREAARLAGDIPSIKAALALLGRDSGRFRVALTPASRDRVAELRARLAAEPDPSGAPGVPPTP